MPARRTEALYQASFTLRADSALVIAGIYKAGGCRWALAGGRLAGVTATNLPQEFKLINIREQHPRDAAEVYRDYMDVGIRELRAHLSKYVRKAAGGEQIIVTDRGRPVARLVGLGTPMLERGIAEGWMTPPRRSGLTPAVYYRTALSTIDVIDEDRG